MKYRRNPQFHWNQLPPPSLLFTNFSSPPRALSLSQLYSSKLRFIIIVSCFTCHEVYQTILLCSLPSFQDISMYIGKRSWPIILSIFSWTWRLEQQQHVPLSSLAWWMADRGCWLAAEERTKGLAAVEERRNCNICTMCKTRSGKHSKNCKSFPQN